MYICYVVHMCLHVHIYCVMEFGTDKQWLIISIQCLFFWSITKENKNVIFAMHTSAEFVLWTYECVFFSHTISQHYLWIVSMETLFPVLPTLLIFLCWTHDSVFSNVKTVSSHHEVIKVSCMLLSEYTFHCCHFNLQSKICSARN